MDDMTSFWNMKASEMTYRDYLVGQVLHAVLQGAGAMPSESGAAETAVTYANAVIVELERQRKAALASRK